MIKFALQGHDPTIQNVAAHQPSSLMMLTHLSGPPLSGKKKERDMPTLLPSTQTSLRWCCSSRTQCECELSFCV